MNIRRMNDADIPELCRMDSELFEDAWSIDFFKDELKKDYAYCCVLENDGIICGYAVIWCIYETAELIRIAVDVKHQKKGLGGVIMNDIIAMAQTRGCEKMMLEVRSSNMAAQALYKKYGFGKIAIRKRYYGGTEDAVIMEREI